MKFLSCITRFNGFILTPVMDNTCYNAHGFIQSFLTQSAKSKKASEAFLDSKPS